MDLLTRGLNFVFRLKIMRYMPDRMYLKMRYKLAIRKTLDLNNPVTFNEKLQWLKLYDRKPDYVTMVDKFEVKKYVAERIGEEHIIPTLGVWKKYDDIDFDLLPNQFVLKCTHDSGGLVVCRDKASLEKTKSRKKIMKSLKHNYYWLGREWPYKGVRPQIIAEKYMEEKSNSLEDGITSELTDYKFYCFNGEPRFLYVSKGLDRHDTARISFLTMDWEFAPYKRSDFAQFDYLPAKPQTFDKMVEITRVLAKDIPFVRVDLYEINGKTYFSELTFSPCSGFMPFVDEKHDIEIGRMLELPKKTDTSFAK